MTAENKKPKYESLGECLVALREKANMTTAEVAKASGIEEASYVGMESGTVFPRFRFLWPVANALGVSVQDLMA